jgi:hypothetical protein
MAIEPVLFDGSRWKTRYATGAVSVIVSVGAAGVVSVTTLEVSDAATSSVTTTRYRAACGLPGSIANSPPICGAKQKNGSLGCDRTGSGARKLDGCPIIASPTGCPSTFPPMWTHRAGASFAVFRSLPSDVSTV